MLLLLLLQLWCGKGFTAMTAHTLLITSCLAGLSLLAQSLPGIYLCLEKRTGPFIFSSFSSSCGTGVASSCPCWSPRALTSGSLLGASSEVIGHPTPLASTSHPSAWLHGFIPPASVLCCCSQTLLLSSRYFISFCGWRLVMKSPCCSFLPQRWIF